MPRVMTEPITDRRGNALHGIDLTVKIDSTAAVATLYTARTGGVAIVASGITTNHDGYPAQTESGDPLWWEVDSYRYELSGIELSDGPATRYPEAARGGDFALRSEVPNLDELFATTYQSFTITPSAGIAPVVLTAPFAMQINSCRVLSWLANIAASDTNYWSVLLRRHRAGSAATIATKTTQATGGEAVTSRVDWNYNAVTFDAANKQLQTGDSVDIAFVPTGTPSNWFDPVVTVGYSPL